MKISFLLAALLAFSFQLSAQVSFTLSSTLNVGANPNDVVTADVNGDGFPDLICTDSGTDLITVLTNNGHGGFVLSTSLNVGNNPVSVTMADMNNDGKPDIICGRDSDFSILVLTNDGHGGFELSTSVTANGGADSVIVADFNGDGYTDIACANYAFGSGNTVTVFTNNGSGGFVLACRPIVGSGPNSLVAADFNGDGKIDLAAASIGSSTVSVLTNDGAGVFGLKATLNVGSNPYGITAADVNGDGKTDLVTGNRGNNTLTVLTNDGSGNFSVSVSPSVGSGPQGVVAADVNGDGALDLICANSIANTLTVLTNNRNGNFIFAATLNAGVGCVTLTSADLNMDGKPDIIGVNNGGNTLFVFTNGTTFPPSIPTITTQPVGQTNLVGSAAIFSVGVQGSAPLYYQWQFNGTNLFGATNSTLSLSNLVLNQAGPYDVIITNNYGSVTSSLAMLGVQFIIVEVNGQIDNGTASAISPATITILGGYPGGYLFYTIDGTTPTTSSPFYTGSFALTNSVTIQTLSLSSDFTQQAYGNPVNVQIIPTYNLQTSIVGFGTISTNPPGGLYASNSVVTLIATAGSTNWSFAHWAGDTNTTQDPLSITMNGPHNVQAVFVQSYYPLTLTTLGGGRVTANGVTIGASTYFVTNSLVALAATPSNGWVFMGWQGSITSTNNPYILNITQTNNIQAIFGASATTNSVGGAIVLSQPNPIPYGTKLTVSAIPNPGNYFALWNGALSGSASPTNVVVTTTNLGFGAFFSVLPTGKYSLSAVANGNGFVTVNPFQSYYNLGDSVTLTASTNPGAYFLGWSGAASGGSNPLTIQVASNEVVQANFGTGSSVSISPLSLTVLAGSNATLTANALGVQPLYYQWLNGQGAVAGATNFTLVISNAQPASAGNYWVVVSNFLCMATSSVANITVIGAPMITNPPVPVTVTVGHNASFAVGTYGAPSLAYQWWLNGALVSGATNALLTIPNSFPANAGYYAVQITNEYGAATSSPVWLTVLPLNLFVPSKIVNGQFQITFDTASGLDYEVQYSTNMINWYPWLYVGGSGESQTLIDPFAGTNVSRFYRVILSQ